MDEMEKEAARMGREDGQGGQHSAWTHAPKPAALRRYEARREENIAALKAERVGAVGLARAEAVVREGGQRYAEMISAEANERFAAAQAAAEETSEMRHGFAAIPMWVTIAVATLILLADVVFTQMALVQSLGNIYAWEAWVLAGVIGALLFGAGVGKAYIEAVRSRADDAGEQGPFSPRAGKALIRFVFWPTVVMLVALAFARISLIDWETDNLAEWVAAIGALIGITMAAALVAVVAYMAGRIIFASRPRASALRELRKAEANRSSARLDLDRKIRLREEAEATVEGLDATFEKAVVMANEAWMAVIALYWRGFAQARPDEQPDIDRINALTNGHREMAREEVYG